MKTFKRIAAVLLLIVLCLSLCACGSRKVTLKLLDTAYAEEDYAICCAKENTELLEKIDAALEELIADGTVQKVLDYYISGTGTLPAIQKNAANYTEVLSMGTNAEFPPYEYFENEAVTGIDPSIAGLIADKLGMKLEVQHMDFDAIIPAVTTGKVLIGMAGMTVTEDRLKSINFSVSYATGIQSVIVRSDSKIASVDDLFAAGVNHTVGVQLNTTGDIYATGDIEDAGLGSIQRFNKGADAVAALVSGKLDCVIIDNEPAKAFVAANNK